jgi:hypothetical protein
VGSNPGEGMAWYLWAGYLRMHKQNCLQHPNLSKRKKPNNFFCLYYCGFVAVLSTKILRNIVKMCKTFRRDGFVEHFFAEDICSSLAVKGLNIESCKRSRTCIPVSYVNDTSITITVLPSLFWCSLWQDLPVIWGSKGRDLSWVIL